MHRSIFSTQPDLLIQSNMEGVKRTEFYTQPFRLVPAIFAILSVTLVVGIRSFDVLRYAVNTIVFAHGTGSGLWTSVP